MGDAARVQLLQQAARALEIGDVAARRALVHRRAVEIAAIEHAAVPAQQLRRRRHAGDAAQCARLASRQPPRRQAQPQRHMARGRDARTGPAASRINAMRPKLSAFSAWISMASACVIATV